MAAAKTTARAARPQHVCERCGIAFSTYPSKPVARYCSYACCAATRRETGAWPRSEQRIACTCERCGAVSMLTPSRAAVARFCSSACMLEWRAPVLSAARYQPETHTTTECGWCLRTFATRWCILRSGRGRFCSRQCRAAYSARRCQSRVSKAETAFGEAMSRAGLSPVAQHRIGRWTVDFFFPSHGLAVEFDGEYWHSLPRVIEKDARKTKALAKSRVRLVRVPERVWLDDPAAAVGLVVAALAGVRQALSSTA